jgi:hypothetical protein
MENKLEEIKQMGNYNVQLWFGEGIGCDDSSVVLMERKVMVMFSPVGCLGETRIFYKGSLKHFLEFNFKTKPIKLHNPPKKKEYEEDGYYIWGTERSIDDILKKPFFGKWI